MWAKNYSSCIDCGTTDRKHMARGLCARCYSRQPHAKAMRTKWYMDNIKGTPRSRLSREKANFDNHRQEVLERDGYRCTRCGSTKSLVVHHLDGSGRESECRDHSVDRLTTLCRPCHVVEHHTLNRWSEFHDCCVICGRTDRHHGAKGLCWHCYLQEKNPPKYKGKALWSWRHGNSCTSCGTSSVRHKGNGLCQICHAKARHKKNREAKIQSELGGDVEKVPETSTSPEPNLWQ